MDALTDFQLGLIVIGIALLFAGLVLWALVRLIRRLLPAPARRKTRVARARRRSIIDDDSDIELNPSTGIIMTEAGVDMGGYMYGEHVKIYPEHK